jgi:hypothetical protein
MEMVPKVVRGIIQTPADRGVLVTGAVDCFLDGLEFVYIMPLIDGKTTISQLGFLVRDVVQSERLGLVLSHLERAGIIELNAGGQQSATDPQQHGFKTSFSDLLAPLSVRAFAQDCQLGRVRHVSGVVNKCSHLFSLTKFKQACAHAPYVGATYTSADRQSMEPSVQISPAEVDAHYAKGATVCVTGIERLIGELGLLVESCRRELAFTGHIDCRAYLSGDCAGYTPHFDDKTVVTFQVEGQKTWLVSETPAVPYPLCNAGRFADGVYRYFRMQSSEEPWERFEQPRFPAEAAQYVLRPGDFLIVPAGVWHEAKAERHSLALALTLGYVGGGSVHDVVLSILRRRLIAQSSWRGPFPMTPFLESDNVARGDDIGSFTLQHLHSLRSIVDELIVDRSPIVDELRTRILR